MSRSRNFALKSISNTMWRIILIGLGTLVGIIIVLIALGAWHLNPSADKVLDFMAKNPERSAILLVRNDTALVSHRANVVIPLASTMKIIIAIEYAQQAAAGMLHPDDPVSLQALETFYVPHTDGGAHTTWLKAVAPKVHDNTVPLREVVKGMIQFSSNANTEWLMDKLGLERINARLDSLGLSQHTPLYYIVSALFIGKEAHPALKGKRLADALRKMDMAQYRQTAQMIHEKLLRDTTYKNELGDLSLAVQKAWTEKLPASTPAEYVSIMQRMNRKTFSPAAQPLLDEAMETLMENPKNADWLQHAGMKGGSTMFLLTKALYATDKQGQTTEIAYFLHGLSPIDMLGLQGSMNEFELNILSQPAFRQKAVSRLGARH